jgi:hypothetical protein
MLKRVRPLTVMLAPMLGMTIFFAAQGGLQMVRPDGLEIRITPRTTADYRPWAVDHFQPVDPELSTVVAREANPTSVIVNTPNPNYIIPAVDVPTTDPRARIAVTPTLALAAPRTRPSLTPTPKPSATPVPTDTLSPEDAAALTGTPTETPDPKATAGKPKPTRKPRVKPSPVKGNGNGNGGGNGGGKGK